MGESMSQKPSAADASTGPKMRAAASVSAAAAHTSAHGTSPRLVPQAEVYWMGNPTNPVPDYVVFDLESHVWHDDPDPDGARWATERHGVEFETVLEADSFQVATRVTP